MSKYLTRSRGDHIGSWHVLTLLPSLLMKVRKEETDLQFIVHTLQRHKTTHCHCNSSSSCPPAFGDAISRYPRHLFFLGLPRGPFVLPGSEYASVCSIVISGRTVQWHDPLSSGYWGILSNIGFFVIASRTVWRHAGGILVQP